MLFVKTINTSFSLKFCFLALLLFGSCISGSAHPLDLLTNGGYILADQDIMEEHNKDVSYIPASTIKIATSLLALDVLGADYRFTTTIYQDLQKNLYIKGGGDPFLTSETIAVLAQKLKNKGISTVNNLILDDSDYQLETAIPDGSENSVNPYDTSNGALVVNFNALPILIQKSGNISSSEPQTPTLPLTRQIGQDFPPGKHRVNINAYTLNDGKKMPLQYAGELFVALLTQEGISIKGTIKSGTVSHQANLLLSHKSKKTCKEIIKSCLKFSNNFIANQLFLEAGKQRYGAPATWQKARQGVEEYFQTIYPSGGSFPKVIEGSGLSRKNTITAGQLLVLLEKFKPYAKDLLPEKKQAYVKSGTLKDVYCYAGYIPKNNKLVSFVILLNQKQNNRNELLEHLKNKLSLTTL